MPIDPPRSELNEPRRLGDYFIHRLLGQGGMGKVYEAEEQLSHRRVALKVLRNDLDQIPESRRRFVAEMGILSQLDDPHIVRCLHCAEIEGQLVMVLELLEGQTLREVLVERRALPWTEVVGIAWQIASALRTAHACQPAIVHRDLKPENVMQLGDGRLKVMDFGIAKILETAGGNTTSYPVGTLQYMSPEQIDARPIDGRSDLYALGLVMWELLAGVPPFQSDSPRVLLEKLCTEAAPRLPDYALRFMPQGAEQLIAWLLEKDPDRRPRDANQVLAQLERLSAPSVPAPSPQPARRESVQPVGPAPAPLNTMAILDSIERRPSTFNWAIAAAIVGVLLTVVIIGGMIKLLGNRSTDSPSQPTNRSVVSSPIERATPPSDPASSCTEHAQDWAGAWTLRTEATQANNLSWVGGRSDYELSLDVDGCRLRGSGRKVTRGKLIWTFTAEGTVAGDGAAAIDYTAKGRNVAGTWSLSKAGAGTWSSAAQDVSGTVTASKSDSDR